MEQALWSHLPVLLRANSKDSIEYILQALWRTRKTGLQSADRCIIIDMLQLENDSDLDSVSPLMICLDGFWILLVQIIIVTLSTASGLPQNVNQEMRL